MTPPVAVRDTALDALRTVAVLLMIASHSTRLIVWDERRDWSRWSLVIEPFTASLFLLLVGASVVQSWRKAQTAGVPRAAWLKKQGIRALALWALSSVFYLVSDGPNLPDVLVLSGILCTIAYTSLAASLLVSGRRPIIALALLAAAMGAVFAWLDLEEHRVFILNAGNSPLLPLSLFGILGALATAGLFAKPRLVKPVLLGASVLALAWLLWLHPFQELFTKPVGRYETARIFMLGEGESLREKSIPYYNLRVILAPAILSLAALLYALFSVLRPLLDKIAAWAFRLGRRSLDVYILHLACLSLLVVVGGKRPLKQTWQGDAVVISVTILCYLWVWGRDWRQARTRRNEAGPGRDRDPGFA